ncbi:hypothetical protein SCP_0101330 [Sparassis crispa]|uniref:Copper transporter n=1 Tax=Sparassis crispa TaxID=139825 RepID=A0A401G530_9APHY|nr:hypothetical protein SCP_0101330 [Sparassis crispa]GBE77260.1 hypothetical protein SCP_0101330 [Sparassis crispa]
MKMSDAWENHLHLSLLGEHVLFRHLQLDSAWTFILASILTVFICLTERLLTYGLSNRWDPSRSCRSGSRLRILVWRTCLYWVVTFDRLLYMLIAMTFNLGLIIITATSLSAGQFVIEYLNTPAAHPPDPENVKEPLLSDCYEPPTRRESYPPPVNTTGRPRSKSKPESIFIHPSESNIARADVAAMQLGLSGDTDIVKWNAYPDNGDAWQLGKGKDVARELLGRP